MNEYQKHVENLPDDFWDEEERVLNQIRQKNHQVDKELQMTNETLHKRFTDIDTSKF